MNSTIPWPEFRGLGQCDIAVPGWPGLRPGMTVNPCESPEWALPISGVQTGSRISAFSAFRELILYKPSAYNVIAGLPPGNPDCVATLTLAAFLVRDHHRSRPFVSPSKGEGSAFLSPRGLKAKRMIYDDHSSPKRLR